MIVLQQMTCIPLRYKYIAIYNTQMIDKNAEYGYTYVRDLLIRCFLNSSDNFWRRARLNVPYNRSDNSHSNLRNSVLIAEIQ